MGLQRLIPVWPIQFRPNDFLHCRIKLGHRSTFRPQTVHCGLPGFVKELGMAKHGNPWVKFIPPSFRTDSGHG